MRHRSLTVVVAALALIIGPFVWGLPAELQDNTDQRLSDLEQRLTLLEATVTTSGAGLAAPGAADPPEVFTITGELEFDGVRNDDFTRPLSGKGCFGEGGYDDIGPGAQVRVTDAAGEILGISSLEPVANRSRCLFEFTVEVPRLDFYTVAAGASHRSGITYSFDEMVDSDWEVSLYLG